MIELAEAGGHFTAAGARGRDHHDGAAGLDIVVLAQAFVADDVLNVGGVSRDGIVAAAADPSAVSRWMKASAAGWPAYWVMTTEPT